MKSHLVLFEILRRNNLLYIKNTIAMFKIRLSVRYVSKLSAK